MRQILVPSILLLGLLGACSTPAGGKGPAPITPTERYTLQTTERPEQIALAAHAEGLSEAQRAALARYADGWSQSGGGVIDISAPSAGGEAAARFAWSAKSALQGWGVPPEAIRVSARAGDPAGAPVLVVYARVEAVVPECGRSWTNIHATRNNDTQKNFGCAVTANMAAQIEDARDIRGPRPLDPADAARRGVVLGKYRQGEPTTAKSDQPNAGQVSTAVRQ